LKNLVTSVLQCMQSDVAVWGEKKDKISSHFIWSHLGVSEGDWFPPTSGLRTWTAMAWRGHTECSVVVSPCTSVYQISILQLRFLSTARPERPPPVDLSSHAQFWEQLHSIHRRNFNCDCTNNTKNFHLGATKFTWSSTTYSWTWVFGDVWHAALGNYKAHNLLKDSQ
jgi:hypothetical protein